MATTFVKTFATKDAAATWAAQMVATRYHVVMNDAPASVRLEKEDGTDWAAVTGGLIVVMAYDKGVAGGG
uniref:hypothetical protein n=1 Tax=Sphingomonas sp. GlSt437 TaxID=3389970 RepID=UPI003A8BF2BB